MAFDDLRSFLQALDDQGQLLKISEEVTAEPGLGRWLVSSIGARDFNSVQACMMVIAITLIVINVFSELLTALFYPAKRKAIYAQQG